LPNLGIHVTKLSSFVKFGKFRHMVFYPIPDSLPSTEISLEFSLMPKPRNPNPYPRSGSPRSRVRMPNREGPVHPPDAQPHKLCVSAPGRTRNPSAAELLGKTSFQAPFGAFTRRGVAVDRGWNAGARVAKLYAVCVPLPVHFRQLQLCIPYQTYPPASTFPGRMVRDKLATSCTRLV
jgi:hypothetical protein